MTKRFHPIVSKLFPVRFALMGIALLMLILPAFGIGTRAEEKKGTIDMQDQKAILTSADGHLSAEIDLKTGTVRSVSLDETPVFASVDEKIRIFYQGADSSTVHLSDCSVTSSKAQDGVLTLTLGHDSLTSKNISLEIQYSFSEDRLCRKIYLTNEGDQLWFLEGHVETELSPAYRSGGYYYLPWPSGRPLVEADKIKENYQQPSVIYGPHSSAMTGFYQPQSNVTAVSTLIAQNDEFAGTSYTQRHNLSDSSSWLGEQPVLTPTGWTHRTNRASLPSGGSFSYEVDLYVTKGDTTEFFTKYLTNPLLQEAAKGNLRGSDSWASDVKYTQYILPGYALLSKDDTNSLQFFNRLSETAASGLSQGHVMTLVNYYGWTGGTHPSNEETAKMKAGTAFFSSQFDSVKIGQFDFSALVPKYQNDVTELFQTHPEWAINGSPVIQRYAQWYQEEGNFYPEGRYTFQYALEEVRDYIESCAKSIALETAPQFVYLEDKESAFAPDFDYTNGLVFTDADNRDALSRYRDALHESGALLWINDPDSVVGDMVQLEMASGVWQPGLDSWENWRTVSDALYLAKARQDAYADGAVNLIYPYEYDRYFSYVLAYAAIPNFAPDNIVTLNREIVPLMPYINARYEIRNGKLVDGSADITPAWRRDSSVMTDVVGLILGENCGILTAVHNDANSVTETIGANSQSLNIDPEKITFLWELSMTNPGPSYEGFSQKTERRVLPKRDSANAPAVVTDKLSVTSGSDRIEALLSLEPYMAKMVCATNVPAYISSVDGYGLQYKLSEALGVKVTGSCPSEGPYSVNISVTEPEQAVVAVYLKDAALPLQLDGKTITYETVEWDGSLFALIQVSKGEHTVRIGEDIHSDETVGPEKEPASNANDSSLTPGQIIGLAVSGTASILLCGLMGFFIGKRRKRLK
ncbi:MAG: hypothetical protein IJT60_03930 [Clostridia bacterium]|nr:hypothetical protein [Clostridia bacterium]